MAAVPVGDNVARQRVSVPLITSTLPVAWRTEVGGVTVIVKMSVCS
jgi:hypothetical protein